MEMSMELMNAKTADEQAVESSDAEYQKGVLHLCQSGITRIPHKYVLPVSDRPTTGTEEEENNMAAREAANLVDLKLPAIDFAELQGSERPRALKLLAKACEEYGFFQVINHGIPVETIQNAIDAARQFFELPFEERAKYMSADMHSLVRYGTSFNQNKDSVFCWRDFLKLMCSHPLSDVLPSWPSSPSDFRPALVSHSQQTKTLFLKLMEAVLESLGLASENDDNYINDMLENFEDGSQLMVINCYPSCPEPDLTLGMPPHSDYGFLTLLIQDNSPPGLQIQHQGKWVTVKPLPNAFVVNVGDHLEIFSNGRYKSVLHRVLVNSVRSRISIASLHTLPLSNTIRPSSKLIDESNPRLYKDTNFMCFLDYISSCEPKAKNFLESRKLTLTK